VDCRIDRTRKADTDDDDDGGDQGRRQLSRFVSLCLYSLLAEIKMIANETVDKPRNDKCASREERGRGETDGRCEEKRLFRTD
jgi:hypothetical protein